VAHLGYESFILARISLAESVFGLIGERGSIWLGGWNRCQSCPPHLCSPILHSSPYFVSSNDVLLVLMSGRNRCQSGGPLDHQSCILTRISLGQTVFGCFDKGAQIGWATMEFVTHLGLPIIHLNPYFVSLKRVWAHSEDGVRLTRIRDLSILHSSPYFLSSNGVSPATNSAGPSRFTNPSFQPVFP
jgi:hypothetical protein